MSLIFSEDARDGSQTPVLVRLVKFGRRNTCIIQLLPKLLELMLVFDGAMDVAWMTVDRTTIGVSVFNGRMACLNSLLREWEVSTRDGVEVGFFNLKLRHDASFFNVTLIQG